MTNAKKQKWRHMARAARMPLDLIERPLDPSLLPWSTILARPFQE